MLTLAAVAAYEASDLRYLGPLDPSLGGGAVRALLASVPTAELAAPETLLAYRPQRAAGAAAFEPYHGVQRELLLPHPEAGRPPLRVRALVVWSPGKARLDAQARATHLTRLETTLRDLASKVGRRPYTTVRAVEKRVATLLRHNPARPFMTVTVQAGEAGPTLNWTRQAAALAAAATLDGRYVLGTNEWRLTADEQLATAKQRDVPEKRYALLKGPLAVRPCYLHKQERILSLVFCTMVALLLFALLEWELRQSGRTARASPEFPFQQGKEQQGDHCAEDQAEDALLLVQVHWTHGQGALEQRVALLGTSRCLAVASCSSAVSRHSLVPST